MEIVIVGSGPASAAAALAVERVPGARITVVDVGSQLESERVEARRAMASVAPGEWRQSDAELLTALPGRAPRGALPTKQIFGSNFVFDDFGQIGGIAGANPLVVSGAYGGFTNTWGAQMVPYSTGTFRTWPVSRRDMEPHYREILRQIPYSGQSDDLEEVFPLMGDPDPLPKVSDRTSMVLDRYAENRIKIRGHGVTAGHARLALRGSACRLCGHCMTGCVYDLIYSASQTFDELRRRNAVDYRPGLLVHRIEEDASGQVFVHAAERSTGRAHTIQADRVFIGAGAIGTTRIVTNSLGYTDRTIRMEESVQFVMPFLSRRAVAELSQSGEFTLNQFNLLVSFDSDGKDAAFVHCYPYNDIMLTTLPEIATRPGFSRLVERGFRHLTVGLGYLPSWMSPPLRLRIGPAKRDAALPDVEITASENPATEPGMKKVIAQLRRVGPALDLYPVPGQTQLSPPTKSYHFGGSFPMSDQPGDFSSDVSGRVRPWKNVHLIDASVFPTVPATTITLTTMANAHRIATLATAKA